MTPPEEFADGFSNRENAGGYVNEYNEKFAAGVRRAMGNQAFKEEGTGKALDSVAALFSSVRT